MSDIFIAEIYGDHSKQMVGPFSSIPSIVAWVNTVAGTWVPKIEDLNPKVLEEGTTEIEPIVEHFTNMFVTVKYKTKYGLTTVTQIKIHKLISTDEVAKPSLRSGH